jgi:hypothetical protein
MTVVSYVEGQHGRSEFAGRGRCAPLGAFHSDIIRCGGMLTMARNSGARHLPPAGLAEPQGALPVRTRPGRRSALALPPKDFFVICLARSQASIRGLRQLEGI